jgi:hypothetical protein
LAGASLQLARGLLFVLAASLPFEVPVCQLGRLELTTVEIVLYSTLAAWGLFVVLDLGLRGRTVMAALSCARKDPLVVATVAWTIVLFATAAATSNRLATGKFALRSLSGILVFFAARSLARPAVVARRLVFAVLAGAWLSAASALSESLAPQASGWLRLFRDESFAAFGLLRASGVFGYPTIGAMYWEAALPLVVVACVGGDETMQSARRPTWHAFLGSAVLAGGIVASATRSSLAGSTLACALLFVLTRRWPGAVARAATAALTALLATSILAATAPGAGALARQRLRFWEDDAWFGVTYDLESDTRTVERGESFTTPITLHNAGTLTWRHTGEKATTLGCHWYRKESGAPDTMTLFEGPRTTLPADVPPHGTVRVEGVASAPSAPGTYRLAWDAVQEDVTWFGEHGNKTADVVVTVVPRTTAPSMPVASERDLSRHEVAPPPPRRALWRAAVTLWLEHPLLGIGPDNFRRRYEPILSPAPNGEPYLDTRIHANSLYFETLADMGLAGLVALAAVGAALLVVAREHWRGRRATGLGVSVAAASFFVHGVSDYFMEFTPAFGLYWMLLGLTAATTPVGEGPDKTP